MEDDLRSQLGADTALNSQNIATATVDGNIIDSQGFESLTFSFQSGALTNDTTTTWTVTLFDGDDSALSDAALVSSDFLIGTVPIFTALTPDESNTVKLLGYVGKKRYVRASITGVDATTGVFSAAAIKGRPASSPTA